MAYHLQQAEEDESAIGFYLKSGSNCLYNYAHKEAITFFTEAISLIAKLKRLGTLEAIEVERKLGQAYYHLGQLTQAGKHFRTALEMMG